MSGRPVRVSAPRSSFAGFRFPPEVIILRCGGTCASGCPNGDMEELLAERGHPVRRQQAPAQATVDSSERRHVSQLRCGSDHDLERCAGDPHGQTTTWSRYTSITDAPVYPHCGAPRHSSGSSDGVIRAR
jgi:hypothetical protein